MANTHDDVTASAGERGYTNYLLRYPFVDHTESAWYDGAFDLDGIFSSSSSSADFAQLSRHRLQLFNKTSPCGAPSADGYTADPDVRVDCNITSSNDDEFQQLAGNYWALILLVFPLLTVFGNVLVAMSVYRERSLQSVTNYFIVSLAIADIMVAILVMPLAVYVEVCCPLYDR